MIRMFDIFFSVIGLILSSPIFLVFAIWIKVDSLGKVFFKQTRVGQHGRAFSLLKFRTMRPMSEQLGQLTIGNRDPRITNSGLALRKYKLDELPQLINVLRGEMSLVGPRPEVPKYVKLYTRDQKRVLEVKPGITDTASLAYFNENEVLAASDNPEITYINEIMPAKLKFNMEFIEASSLRSYFSIIYRTIIKIVIAIF